MLSDLKIWDTDRTELSLWESERSIVIGQANCSHLSHETIVACAYILIGENDAVVKVLSTAPTTL